MSWMSRRVTTRAEDMAYCLMGIFNVHMPLLYGEGDHAFVRLQEEIIKRSDDHSIFAWSLPSWQPQDFPPRIYDRFHRGLLATGPACFRNSQSFRPVPVPTGQEPYALTNRGISIKLLAIQYATDVYCAQLNCACQPENGSGVPDESFYGIFLLREGEDDQFMRVQYDG
ncbi:hypothetical protein K402DRAFT_297508, partial [Aulographum hederae CBS 113979]